MTVTCLMPGVTDTKFFERADMMDTKVGTKENKADPARVAKIGFEAMMKGESDVVAGLKNKLQVAMTGVMPKEALAEQHRKTAQPGAVAGLRWSLDQCQSARTSSVSARRAVRFRQ